MRDANAVCVVCGGEYAYENAVRDEMEKERKKKTLIIFQVIEINGAR